MCVLYFVHLPDFRPQTLRYQASFSTNIYHKQDYIKVRIDSRPKNLSLFPIFCHKMDLDIILFPIFNKKKLQLTLFLGIILASTPPCDIVGRREGTPLLAIGGSWTMPTGIPIGGLPNQDIISYCLISANTQNN